METSLCLDNCPMLLFENRQSPHERIIKVRRESEEKQVKIKIKQGILVEFDKKIPNHEEYGTIFF